ncbi:helix-turn-helix domain-containing protein [Pelagerythrobacter sp.]|uniref:helix-turn-helix domain-containing protein n=1 Tax=Pelagerythrobacter sp. TaxID=2800702 RepID=UPI0035B0D49A
MQHEGEHLVAVGGKENPIRSLTGATLAGAPLAASRKAAPDLAPWFQWISAAAGEVAPDQTVHCGMLGDNPVIRILFGGTWTAQTADGAMTFEPGEGLALYFGPQTRYMPISVAGSYRVITLMLGAGAAPVLGLPEQTSMLDRIVDFDGLTGAAPLAKSIPQERGYGDWLAALEGELRRRLAREKPDPPDPTATAFARACLTRPDFRIGGFAAHRAISQRTLERTIKRNFGLTPKQVMRRARALDTAARLLGVALPEEEAALELRYYDQSHQSREVRRFFGFTPGELMRGAHPMLRLNIELRQSRRLATLIEGGAEIGSESHRPWRDPAAEFDIEG